MEGRPPEEAVLVERAREGDIDAYEELVRRYQTIAFRTACLVCPTPADAEEVAQDAFVKAQRALPRFRSGAPFRPWLLSIVANEARNSVRGAARRQAAWLRATEDRRTTGTAPPADAAVLASERQESLLGALADLGESDRLVIAGRYLLELDESELAELLGCRRGTVKSRLSRALERLRASVDDKEILRG